MPCRVARCQLHVFLVKGQALETLMSLHTLENFSKPPSLSLITLIQCCALEYRRFSASLNGASQGSSLMTPFISQLARIAVLFGNSLSRTCAILGNALLLWLSCHGAKMLRTWGGGVAERRAGAHYAWEKQSFGDPEEYERYSYIYGALRQKEKEWIRVAPQLN